MTRRSSPTLFAGVRSVIDDALGELHVGMPARVESYSTTTQKCSVQPLIWRVYETEDGDRAAERLPVITDVPVCFPGAGGWRLTFPISRGDTVWLEFASASLALWLQRGGEVDPEDPRRHVLSDAVAFPGVRDFAHALSGVSSSSMVLGDGSTQIEITADGAVQLGGPGTFNPITDGVVSGNATDPSTGLFLWQLGSSSSKVFTK